MYIVEEQVFHIVSIDRDEYPFCDHSSVIKSCIVMTVGMHTYNYMHCMTQATNVYDIFGCMAGRKKYEIAKKTDCNI